MNPYVKLCLKSCGLFVGALSVNWGALKALGQISLIDWLAVGWPGVLVVGAYWVGVADTAPAPWSQAQAMLTAKQTVQDARDAQAVKDELKK